MADAATAQDPWASVASPAPVATDTTADPWAGVASPAPAELPKLPDTTNIEKSAQDNITAQESNVTPQTPVQNLTAAMGHNPVAPYQQGGVIPQPIVQHVMDCYKNGTATTAADCMQSTVPQVAASIQPNKENAPLQADSPAVSFLKGLGISSPQILTSIPAFTATSALTAKTLTPLAKGKASTLAVGATSIIAGTLAAMAASGITKEGQDAFLKAHPEMANAAGVSQEQLALDLKEHPWAFKAGTAASNLIAFKPGISSLKQMLVNAGIMGGTETGREVVSGENIDPLNILAQAATGAIMKNNAFGEKLSSFGEGIAAKAAAGYNALRPAVAQQMNVPPNEVTNNHIDDAVAASYPHDAIAHAIDYDHAATAMFGEDGAAKGADLLRDITAKTGGQVRPEQVFYDARESPSIAEDLRNGVFPKAYDHLIQQQPIPKAPDGVQYTTLDPSSKEFSIVKMIAAGKGIDLQPAPKAREAPRETVTATVDQQKVVEPVTESNQETPPKSPEQVSAEKAHTEQYHVVRNLKKSIEDKKAEVSAAGSKAGKKQAKWELGVLRSQYRGEIELKKKLAAAAGIKLGNSGNLITNEQSAIGFIKRMGGIKPSAETDRYEGNKFNGVFNKNGLSPEDMRASLQEEGYIPPEDPNAPPKSTVDDLHDILDAHDNGIAIYRHGMAGGHESEYDPEKEAYDEAMGAPSGNHTVLDTEGHEIPFAQKTGDVYIPPGLSKEGVGFWATPHLLESEIDRQVLDLINKLAPDANVRLYGQAAIDEGTVHGSVFSDRESMERIIGIAMEHNPDVLHTGRHEVIHWLKEKGLITDDEWKTLSDESDKNGWIEKHDPTGKYKEKDHAYRTEEAIAEEFGKGGVDKFSSVPESIRPIFQKIADFFSRLNYNIKQLFGQEITAKDIFDRIERGDSGRGVANESVSGEKEPLGQIKTPEEIIETLKEPAYKKYAEAREELEQAVQGKKTNNSIENLAKTVASGHDQYGAVYDHMSKPSMTEAEEVARNKRVFNMSQPKDEPPTPKKPDQLVNPDFAKEDKVPPTLFGKVSKAISDMISVNPDVRAETKNLSDLGKVAEEDPVMAGKIAARYIHETLSPDTVSGAAEDTATILKERLGVAARETAIAQNALNDVWRSAGKIVGAQKDAFIDYMQNRSNGATIDPALQETADVVRGINQDIEAKLQALPGNEQRAFIKDYFTQNWKDTAIARRVMNEAVARQGSGRNLKQRIIPSHAEGIALGLEDKFDHPLETVMNYVKNVQKYIAHVEAVNDMIEGGMAKRFKGDEDTTGYTKLDGTVGSDNGEGAVYAQDDAARIYNNAISKGFEGTAGEIFKAINFSSNVLRRMKLGLLNFFHAGVITQASMSSEFGLGTKEITGALDKDNPQGAGLSIIKGAARMALSTLAPFKHLAEGGRGLEEYKAPGSTDPRTQQIIDILSRANAITSSMPEYMKSGAQVDLWDGWKRGDFDNFADKASDFVNSLTLKNSAVKIPKLMFQTVARAMDTTVKPLFDWYTPRMKTGAAMEAMGQFMDTHPNATHEEQLQAASAIGDSIDNRMGEMMTQNLFLNRKLEQSINQGFLSYGWVLGQLRGGVGGAKDIAMFKNTPNAQYIIGTIATTALLNTLYQYLHTSKPPQDLRDLMAPKTGGIQNAGGEVVPEREFGPSHESQWYHYANNFTGELFGNESNPLIPFVEMLRSGKNWAGYDVTNRNDPKAMDYIRAMGDQMEPIMISTLEKGAKKGSHLTTAERALGFRQVPAFVANPEGVKEQTKERNERNWEKSQKFDQRQKDSYEQ